MYIAEKKNQTTKKTPTPKKPTTTLCKWLENENIQNILANSDHVRSGAQARPVTNISLALQRKEIF